MGTLLSGGKDKPDRAPEVSNVALELEARRLSQEGVMSARIRAIANMALDAEQKHAENDLH